MPRSPPFVQSDLKKRARPSFACIEALRASENIKNYETRLGERKRPVALERFGDAIKTLKVEAPSRVKCVKELETMFERYRLELQTQQQETPARKAKAFQMAKRWRKRRDNLIKTLLKLDDPIRARPIIEQIEKIPQLPPSLEDEMWRAIMAGVTPDKALDDLSRLYQKRSALEDGSGRIKSVAFMHLVRALQDLATRHRPNFAWQTGTTPPRSLTAFIRDTLHVEGIKCPDEHNQDRLVKLMVSPIMHRLTDAVQNK